MKYFLNNRYIEGGLVIIVLAVTGWVYHELTEAYHFVTVTSGVLYRSGWMEPHGMNEKIKEYGIRTIVNLCLPGEKTYLENNNYIKEQEICQKNEVKLVNLPMPGNIPPTREQINQWLNLLRDRNNLPVLVHCAQGVTRTSTMVAIYQMELLHKSNEEALARLPMFSHKLDIPKNKKIYDFLLNYEPGMHEPQPEREKQLLNFSSGYK
jgi:protein tyrosine/serine phosphatase